MTADEAIIYEHYSIRAAARALANPPGDMQTNRQSAIQIEIAWTAKDIGVLPHTMVAKLKQWMRWVEAQTGVKQLAPRFIGGDAFGRGIAARMSAQEWNSFIGWCRHQHVPENDHWDPGMIDMQRLFAP